MRHRDEEVRPFFGDGSDPIGPPLPPLEHGPRRGTIDQIRQWRIDEGLCPRSCDGELDGEQCCPKCGWSLTEERARDRLRARERPVVDRDDYLPRLPGILMFDEYGPANVDEDAAA